MYDEIYKNNYLLIKYILIPICLYLTIIIDLVIGLAELSSALTLP